jgi:hypothetical protein
VLERVVRFIVSHSSRSISAEREDVPNGRLRISAENCFNFLFVVADAGKMRNRVEFCCVLNALDQVVGQLARRAPRAIRHAHKIRRVTLEIADRFIKRLGRLRGLWREELERKRWRTSLHDVVDVHQSWRYLRSFRKFTSNTKLLRLLTPRFRSRKVRLS